MDEKSSTLKCLLKSSIPEQNNNTTQMRAILTADGKIKIILPTTLRDENYKEKFLLKDTFAQPSSKASSSTNVSICTVNSNSHQDKQTGKGKHHDNESEEDDDDKYADYKITPMQIFCSSICQVSLNYFYFRDGVVIT